MFERKEQIIREQRTIEAMKKGLMGAEGKLCRIARTFGDPIFRQGGANFDASYLPDYDDLGEDEIPTMDEEEVSYRIGMHFDGMRRGIHMEIMWQEEFRELRVYFKGGLVYQEIANQLDGYHPVEEWEKIVEDLYDKVKKSDRITRKEDAKVAAVEARRRQHDFLDAMRLKWGI